MVIDNESYNNVAIRAKGNTSLTQVASYGNDRYSFKIEFDHYDSTISYHGLDKLSLNNIIQDNTYMKDDLTYTGSMIHNYYLYEEDGQLSMIPWDYNLAFGGFQGGQDAASMVNYPIDTPVSGGTVGSRPMLAWIFESEEYTKLYHQYFADFISSYFDSGYFTQMMAQTKQLIADGRQCS